MKQNCKLSRHDLLQAQLDRRIRLAKVEPFTDEQYQVMSELTIGLIAVGIVWTFLLVLVFRD